MGRSVASVHRRPLLMELILIWFGSADCFQALASQRLADVIAAVDRARGGHSEPASGEDGSSKFIHYNCLTLPHLIALISRPTAKGLPQDVALVVFSSMTALINSALPKSHEEQRGPKRDNGTQL